MSRRARRLLLLAAAILGILAALCVLFGQNVRALFAASAAVIAEPPPSAVRGPVGKRDVKDFANAAAAPVAESLAGPRAGYAPPAMARKVLQAPSVTEEYRDYGVNGFVETAEDRLSTFAVDVDTASYTIVRRKLLEGTMPPPAAVRAEELLNYFQYEYRAPETGAFAIHLDAAPSPYVRGRHFVRVALQGKRLTLAERKPAHLTFLVDVSGSMDSPDKLPLAKKALRLLVDNLKDGDTVALVTYASGVREVLQPTGLDRKAEIHAAIEDLVAGGSTSMAGGLELAYRLAARSLGRDSISRVIVLSDGDANVGSTRPEEMLETIRAHVQEGVMLSTVGFGMGNYRDGMMEKLADAGNGNYAYVDDLMAARKHFQEQLGGTLEVIAQDVKIQVEFNAEAVRRYRLIGYENRDVADRDFRNDRVDAGEIGSGHSVTALYEVELREDRGARSLATVRVRAKRPRGERAEETEQELAAGSVYGTFEEAPASLRFASAVAGAAEALRQSPYAQDWHLETTRRIACEAAEGRAERREFCHLLERAGRLEEDRAQERRAPARHGVSGR